MNFQSRPDVIQQGQTVLMNDVIKKAYLLVGVSFLPTILGALIGMANIQAIFNLIVKSPILFFVGHMIAFYGLCFMIEKNRDNTLGVVLMLGFTFLMGVMLAPLLTIAMKSSNGANLIMTAAGGTGALFIALAALGSDKTRDFSFLGKFVGISVLILMATIVLNVLFLKMPVMNLIISAVIIPLSGAIIVYRINDAARGGETSHVSLALDLYIGIYNIFSALLRLLIAFTGND